MEFPARPPGTHFSIKKNDKYFQLKPNHFLRYCIILLLVVSGFTSSGQSSKAINIADFGAVRNSMKDATDAVRNAYSIL